MKRFKNILYVANADDAGTCALGRAATLAENNQARLTVVAVVDALPLGTPFPAQSRTPGDLRST